MNGYNNIYAAAAAAAMSQSLIPTSVPLLTANAMPQALPAKPQLPANTCHHTNSSARKGFSIADILSEPTSTSSSQAQHGSMSNFNIEVSRNADLFSLSPYFTSVPYVTGAGIPQPVNIPFLPAAAVSHHLHAATTQTATAGV